MATDGDRKALESMRKKLDAMMQAEELHAISERRKVMIAPSEAVLLEEQVQEKAQLASELAIARARRRSQEKREDRSNTAVRQHTAEVLSLLKEISELEQLDLPPATCSDGADAVSQRQPKINLNAKVVVLADRSPKSVADRGPKKRALTLSRQATELEAARSAARAAEEYEKKFQQMREELRAEVLEEVFGFAAPTTSAPIEAAQIDLLAELDYGLPQYECLSTEMSLDALVDEFRSRPLWDELCSRASPVKLPVHSACLVANGNGTEKARQRNRGVKRQDEVQINYDDADTPLPKPTIPKVVIPPRMPIPRDNLLKTALEELELLEDDCQKAEVGLKSRQESFRLLSESVDARHAILLSANLAVAPTQVSIAEVPKQLAIFEAPKAFADPVCPKAQVDCAPAAGEAQEIFAEVAEVPVEVLRSRAKRNILQIARLRELAGQSQ